ncbi:MAG TPA: acyl carrier protein [Patescibacteria group bacterium]|nr:acyl carrier protein [Patescibacteria group bacterium]
MIPAEKVLELARKIFKDKSITAASELHDAEGYTSLEHFQFLLDLETEFGVEFTDVEIMRNNTIKEVAEMVAKKKG